MLRVLFLNTTTGKKLVKDLQSIPSIGDGVYMGYSPVPNVTGVVWFPPEEMSGELGHGSCDVLVFLG